MMSKLALRYKHDRSFFDPQLPRDDFGYLSVSVEIEGFSAKGGFWVQWQDVKSFGEALSVYPIAADRPVVAQWGFDMQEGDDVVLRLEFMPADNRGNLAVRFEIADQHEPRNRATGVFLTNYPDVATFREEIGQLLNNAVEEAVLNGR